MKKLFRGSTLSAAQSVCTLLYTTFSTPWSDSLGQILAWVRSLDRLLSTRSGSTTIQPEGSPAMRQTSIVPAIGPRSPELPDLAATVAERTSSLSMTNPGMGRAGGTGSPYLNHRNHDYVFDILTFHGRLFPPTYIYCSFLAKITFHDFIFSIAKAYLGARYPSRQEDSSVSGVLNFEFQASFGETNAPLTISEKTLSSSCDRMTDLHFPHDFLVRL